MVMKIVAYVVIALFVIALGAAAVFYLNTYKPMTDDYARMKAGMQELDKAKSELKKFKDKESKETAWQKPAIDVLSSGLSDEITAGKAEVFIAGNRVIVNIAEDALYLPGSYTFSNAKESIQLRLKLITLLKKNELNGKDIYVGNTTESVTAQGRGRKTVPAKDARALAAERSAVLVKDFEKNGVEQDALIAAAFSSKQPEIGFKIKTKKTTLIIETPPPAPAAVLQQETVKEAPSTKVSTTAPASPQTQPKAIPIQPAQPKAN